MHVNYIDEAAHKPWVFRERPGKPERRFTWSVTRSHDVDGGFEFLLVWRGYLWANPNDFKRRFQRPPYFYRFILRPDAYAAPDFYRHARWFVHSEFLQARWERKRQLSNYR